MYPNLRQLNGESLSTTLSNCSILKHEQVITFADLGTTRICISVDEIWLHDVHVASNEIKMPVMPEVPIVVGVGDFVNRSTSIADAHEPLTLIFNAIETALKDTALDVSKRRKLQSAIDSIDVVRTWTWPYDDLPGDIGRKLGVDAPHKFYSDHGGNKPAKLFDEAARRISKRQTKVAVVTGGEALASREYHPLFPFRPWEGFQMLILIVETCSNGMRCCKETAATRLDQDQRRGQQGLFGDWTGSWEEYVPLLHMQHAHLTSSKTVDSLSGADIGGIHSVGEPIQVYPLYENGFRAHRGQSIADNNEESAQLYAEFAKVAATQPYAWNYGKPAKSKEEIGTVTPRNRMICFPCTSPAAAESSASAPASASDAIDDVAVIDSAMYSIAAC